MNDKQQLAAMGEHMAEQRLCMAKRIEELEAQVRVMAGLLREAKGFVVHVFDSDINYWSDNPLLLNIDEAVSGKMPDAWLPIETAPRDRRKVLVYRPLAENSGDEPIAVKRLTGGRNNSCWDRTVPPGETPCNPTDGSCHVTHWMPLPAAPSPDSAK